MSSRQNKKSSFSTILISIFFVSLIVAGVILVSRPQIFQPKAKGDECGYSGAPNCPTGYKCSRGLCEPINNNSTPPPPDPNNTTCGRNGASSACRSRNNSTNYCYGGVCVQIYSNYSDAYCGSTLGKLIKCPPGTKCQINKTGWGGYYCYPS